MKARHVRKARRTLASAQARLRSAAERTAGPLQQPATHQGRVAANPAIARGLRSMSLAAAALERRDRATFEAETLNVLVAAREAEDSLDARPVSNG